MLQVAYQARTHSTRCKLKVQPRQQEERSTLALSLREGPHRNSSQLLLVLVGGVRLRGLALRLTVLQSHFKAMAKKCTHEERMYRLKQGNERHHPQALRTKS